MLNYVSEWADSKEDGLPLRTISGGSEDNLCFSGDLTPGYSTNWFCSPDLEELGPPGSCWLAYRGNDLVVITLQTLRVEVFALACDSGTISKVTNCLCIRFWGHSWFSFRNLLPCCEVCVCAQLLSQVQLFATTWTVAHQASRSMGFSRQEY